MHHIEGCERDQSQLLPARVDDYVHAENPIRFIEAFADGLDLGKAGFARVDPKMTGRPGYDPADLLKLYIYGYLNRVRSSRRLEAETHRNLEVIWLLRGLRPDFKTIADFRRDNRSAFKAVFREFVLLCRKLDLYGRELVAVDGTRLKAVNSRDRNFTREKLAKFLKTADKRLADYLERLDRTDADESPASSSRARNLADKIASLKERRDRYVAIDAELERTGESQVSLTDPDSRSMALHSKVGVGYNAQVAVDDKHKLIVAFELTNAGSDLGLLAQTAGAAKDALGVDTIEVVADRGYYKGEDIQACEQAGITAYVARPQRGSAVREGFFRKEEFAYDVATDTYRCPNQQHLQRMYRGEHRGVERWSYANRAACQACALRPKCTNTTFRKVARWIDEAVLDRMEARLVAKPEILDRRREIVEHPFGSIKQWMNQGAFLMSLDTPNCSSSTVGPRSGLTGYLSVGATAGNLIFQLVNARYERGAMILTSNRGFSEWADVSGDPVVATALLDRLLHHAVVVQIEGASYRLRQHADLFPDALRPKPTPAPATDAPRRRHGRPRKPADLANTD